VGGLQHEATDHILIGDGRFRGEADMPQRPVAYQPVAIDLRIDTRWSSGNRARLRKEAAPRTIAYLGSATPGTLYWISVSTSSVPALG
jgi:hypothetical protein